MRYKTVLLVTFSLLLADTFTATVFSGVGHRTTPINRYFTRSAEGNSTELRNFCDSIYPPPFTGICPLEGIHTYYLGISYQQIIAIPFIAGKIRIDTIRFFTGSIGGNNLVKIQLFESGLPYHDTLCHECKKPWGYFIDTNDTTGVTAFPENATDTAWQSCTSDSTWYPFGTLLLTIPSFQVLPNQSNILVLANYIQGGLRIDRLEDIYVVIENIGNGTSEPDTTSFMNFATETQSGDCPFDEGGYPVLKFYRQHASFPEGDCRGWWERGLFGDVTYSGVLTGDVPPTISTVTAVSNLLLISGDQEVDAAIIDCNFAHPESAGVASATLEYVINSMQTFSVPMRSTNSLNWTASIPSQPVGNKIDYRVLASDFTGNTDTSAQYSYSIIDLESKFFRCDTMYSCQHTSIRATGTVIDTSQFFLPPISGGSAGIAHKGDDGTAGPFSLGGPFIYFGDTMYYAWVGIDGAIALSKSPADTIDVNASGFYTRGWTFPGQIRHDRRDTTYPVGMPKNFIAPFWADWCLVQDSPFASSGHIRYFTDATKFIVEWDSLGAFDNTVGLMVSDFESFRVIIDRSWNTIEFQYDNVGLGGLDTTNLTGIQGDTILMHDSLPSANFYNKNSRPVQTHLTDGMCVRYIPVLQSLFLDDGWSLVSFPIRSPNMSFKFICPTCIGPGFAFTQTLGYVPTIDSVVPGRGYWVKYSGVGSLGIPGLPITCLNIPIEQGWNLIGSISVPAPVTIITADPGTGITPGTTFFGYAGGYFAASAILPGYGYWCRAFGSGHIHICSSSIPKSVNPIAELNTLHKITISRNGLSGSQTLYIGSGPIEAGRYEMPPGPPDGSFDARFSTNRMVEIYPSILDPAKKYEYPVMITTGKSPLTINWEESRNTEEKVTLRLMSENGKTLAVMNGSGKVTLRDADFKKFIIAVTPGTPLPKVFALGRNFPNPFNPATRFSVDVPRTTTIEVSVYDILGRKIATLWNGEKPAGYHTMEWDGQTNEGLSAPTGMYFVRMTAPAEKFSAVQKTMLIR